MKKLTALIFYAAVAVRAQVDRAGNVIDVDSSDYATGWSPPVFVFIGALAGLLVSVAKPNLLTGPCVIVGCIAGVIVEILV